MMYPKRVSIYDCRQYEHDKGENFRLYVEEGGEEAEIHEAKDAGQLIKFLKGLYEVTPRVVLPEIEE